MIQKCCNLDLLVETCQNCPELEQCTNNKKESIKETFEEKDHMEKNVKKKKRNVSTSLDSFLD